MKYPCRNCIYFNECGSNVRTEKCYGRVTKTQKKQEDSKNEGKSN